MVYTARELITRAFYLSRIRSRNMQDLTGPDVTEGLILLNSILGFQSSNLKLIPYYKSYPFDTITQQEDYFIPNLLGVETLTFDYQQVRWPMEQLSRVQYQGWARANNIYNLPYIYRVERELGGSRIYMYFLPQQVFNMTLWGKFGLTNVTLNEDLTLTYDEFYIEYLRNKLAEYLCLEWGKDINKDLADNLANVTERISYVSPPDLSQQLIGLGGGGANALNYALVNLSNGYLPIGN